jgi:hypothetical protein
MGCKQLYVATDHKSLCVCSATSPWLTWKTRGWPGLRRRRSGGSSPLSIPRASSNCLQIHFPTRSCYESIGDNSYRAERGVSGVVMTVIIGVGFVAKEPIPYSGVGGRAGELVWPVCSVSKTEETRKKQFSSVVAWGACSPRVRCNESVEIGAWSRVRCESQQGSGSCLLMSRR